MRMGAFLLGGLVGAAAVVYFQQNRKNLMMSTMSSTSDSIGKIVEKGMSMAGIGGNAGGANNSKQKANYTSTTFDNKSYEAGKDGLSKVEDMVKKDQSVKQQVDEILEDNNQKSAYQSH
ncbi:hypothetical protein [Paenibacillus hamazuiensis]|uniref:hypothetical protein n=1 Tax=Paenibacillus hamazuiensis TaxID=2936508 RepID=UPI00200FDF5D|nr:hypothetical protein [Paenibacillus hamazuiensis]